MSLITIFGILFLTSCILFAAGVALQIDHAARHRRFQPRLNVLVLALVVASLSPVFNAEAIRADAPDVAARVQVLSSRTTTSSFGPSVFGLHAHFGAHPSGRVFLSSVGARGLPISRTYQRNPIGPTPYPVLWHHGQLVGPDRWSSDAIFPMKASFVLLC